MYRANVKSSKFDGITFNFVPGRPSNSFKWIWILTNEIDFVISQKFVIKTKWWFFAMHKLNTTYFSIFNRHHFRKLCRTNDLIIWFECVRLILAWHMISITAIIIVYTEILPRKEFNTIKRTFENPRRWPWWNSWFERYKYHLIVLNLEKEKYDINKALKSERNNLFDEMCSVGFIKIINTFNDTKSCWIIMKKKNQMIATYFLRKSVSINLV